MLETTVTVSVPDDCVQDADAARDCEVVVIGRTEFLESLPSKPEIAITFLAVLVCKSSMTNRRKVDNVTVNVFTACEDGVNWHMLVNTMPCMFNGNA